MGLAHVMLIAGIWSCRSTDVLTSPEGNSPNLAQAAKVKAVRWKSLVVSSQSTCGLAKDGSAYCWGLNNFGQLGDGTSDFAAALPRPVAGGHRFRQIAHGYTHGCGIDQSRKAWCWGGNYIGQLGTDGSTVPVAVHPIKET